MNTATETPKVRNATIMDLLFFMFAIIFKGDRLSHSMPTQFMDQCNKDKIQYIQALHKYEQKTK